MEIFGIKFAPLNVPLDRRRQTLAAFGWFCTVGLGPAIGWLLTLYFLIFGEWMRYFMLIYFCLIYYERDTHKLGGRAECWIRPLRNSRWARDYCSYFPIKLVKTADLDPSRNYLFCSFPHGMLASGAYGAFGTDILRFNELFPGLVPHMLVLDQHFITPFSREFIHGSRLCGASAESMEYLLRKKDKNEKNCAVVLVVGGAAEAFNCRPSTYRIVLKRRRGFVRIALKTGTPLVPVFSFGETDLYDQVRPPKGSLVNKFQEFVKNTFGYAPILMIGRGFFQYSFGVIPRRKPVTVVVGAPIELPVNSNPTSDEVDKYHEIFTNELINLFESEKHKYLNNAETIKLIIE